MSAVAGPVCLSGFEDFRSFNIKFRICQIFPPLNCSFAMCATIFANSLFCYRSPVPYSVLPFHVLVLFSLSLSLILSYNTIYYSLALSSFLKIPYTILSLSLPFLQYHILFSRCLFLSYNTIYYSLALSSFLTIPYTILSLSLPFLQYHILFCRCLFLSYNTTYYYYSFLSV